MHSYNQDSKVHGTNMVSTWVLSAPDGPHVNPMNLVIRERPWNMDEYSLMDRLAYICCILCQTCFAQDEAIHIHILYTFAIHSYLCMHVYNWRSRLWIFFSIAICYNFEIINYFNTNICKFFFFWGGVKINLCIHNIVSSELFSGMCQNPNQHEYLSN